MPKLKYKNLDEDQRIQCNICGKVLSPYGVGPHIRLKHKLRTSFEKLFKDGKLSVVDSSAEPKQKKAKPKQKKAKPKQRRATAQPAIKTRVMHIPVILEIPITFGEIKILEAGDQ